MIRPDLHGARWPAPPLTRFAPSPTGYLHLGHVANAIYVWGVAAALGGRVRLRIENHDRIRCRPEYERALLEDLEWLGFVPDEGLHPLDRQSDRDAVYEDALRRLSAADRVYGCRCSRRDIGSERYDGRCRHANIHAGPGVGVRVEIQPGTESIDDLLLGRLEQDPAQQTGDLLLRDRDGNWTYQFAVTVDDLQQGITLVIRGTDLVSSTGRQVRLGRMLGRCEPPRYLHHALVPSGRGEKLSKAAADSGIRELRAQGLSAARVVGLAASAVGLLRPGTTISAADVGGLFD